MNGFAIDVVKHWKENPTCQDIISQKSARKFAQRAKTNTHETIFTYRKKYKVYLWYDVLETTIVFSGK